MSKLTNAIDAKSLVIGVLLTVIVFMSMGAEKSTTETPIYKWRNQNKVCAQRLPEMFDEVKIPSKAVPFAVDNGVVYYTYSN